MKKGKILIDFEKCFACKTCEIECAFSHSQEKNFFKFIENPDIMPSVRIKKIGQYNTPLRCLHCDFPSCVVICPTKALKKDENKIIIIENEKCVGCGMCVVVCPYGVPHINRDKKIYTKCDLCIERLKDGQLPACVLSCPNKALKFFEFEEKNEKVRSR
ncbi:MAG: 4Fe-4S dicluster domain-containing protein [Candidatus Omnitrophica bacterium]|nr:4Fe-4S dicluster domain-containing protein [Candidatus Omnitrophota bacterium]